MDPTTIKQLVSLNRIFYQSFARDFSETRQRLQPGVLRVLKQLPNSIKALDMGCGNGELVCALIRAEHRGMYVGLDFSAELLAIAEKSLEQCCSKFNGLQVQLTQADLTLASWTEGVPEIAYQQAFAFAVLHHLPGYMTRLRVLQAARRLLEEGGVLYLSNWQFLNSPRLRARILPWEEIGLNEMSVDQGDYLLDWRRGGQGLRYAHQFSLSELDEMAKQCDFQIVDIFHSDGKGGNLGLYQAWQAV